MSDNESSEYIRILTIKEANGSERRLQFPVKLDLLRPKRPRTTFTEDQLSALEEAFRTNGYLTGSSRAKLAHELGLSDTQVKVWFQNRRTKDRRKITTDNNIKTSSNNHMDTKTSKENTITFPVSFQNSLNIFPIPSPMIYPALSIPSLLDYSRQDNSNTFSSLYYRSCS